MVYKERKGRLSATEASEGTVDLSSATSLKIAHLFVVSEEVSQRREIEHAMCVFSLQGSSDRHIMKGVIVDNSIYISYDECTFFIYDDDEGRRPRVKIVQ